MVPWLLFIGFVLPFLLADRFTTLDGPGHIHNAKIIKALWTDPNSIFANYYELNTFISPNLLGHYLLLLVVEIVGESHADRVMLVLCMLAQFAAFRYFVRSLKLSEALALLPICFLLNTPLFSGFFSFSLGVAALFWTLGFFIRRVDALWVETRVGSSMFALSALLVLVYLLHLVPAVMACVLIAIAWIVSAFERRAHHKWRLKALVKSALPLMCAALPVTLLVIVYQLHDSETSNYVFIESTELWRQWGVMQGFIVNHRHELAFTRWYWLVPGAALLLDVVFYFFKQDFIQRRTISRRAFVLLSCAMLLMAVLYFSMPDASSGGGALTVRLNFLLVAVMMIFILALVRTVLLQWLAIAVLVFVTFDHERKILNYHADQAYFMHDIKEVSKGIDRPGVLLVHRFRYDWPLEHVTKYLGNTHDVVMIDALGGHKIYAPVMWKPELRNNEDMLHMLDQGWKYDPHPWASHFDSEQLYVLTIGDVPQSDSAEWHTWQAFLDERSARAFVSDDSLMTLYRLQ
jgi:hypothetical protein